MPEALETSLYVQDGQQYQYLDDVDEHESYWIIRSDGSLVRAPGHAGNAIKNFAMRINGGDFRRGRPENGSPISSATVGAIKNYLDKMYGLRVRDDQAFSWLQRATRIDDATSSFEGFEDRLIQDIVEKEGGGDPAKTEQILKDVLGDNYDDFISRQKVSELLPEQLLADTDPQIAFAPGVQAGLEAGFAANAAAAGGTYKVKAGDTLSALAAKYGTTVEALAQANGITDPNLILVGATLKIPGAAGATTEGGAGGAANPAVAGAAGAGGGGIGGDAGAGTAGAKTPGAAGAAGTAGAKGTVPQQAGVGPDGQTITPDILQDFLEDPDVGWYAAFNAMVNSFRDAGGAAVFVNWLASKFTEYKGEYMGRIAQQAMDGQVPTGTFQDYLSKKSGGAIPGSRPRVAAPKTGGPAAGAVGTDAGAVGPTPDTGVAAAPLAPDTGALSPSLGETPGLGPPSPILQQYLLGQTA